MMDEELLKILKKIYKTEKFEYINNGISFVDQYLVLEFATDNRKIGIERRGENKVNINFSKWSDYYKKYLLYSSNVCTIEFDSKENKTTLTNSRLGNVRGVYYFDGKVFDFEKEFIVAKLGGN